METYQHRLPEVKLEPQGPRLQSLWDLLDQYKRKRLHIPRHQRDPKRWSEAKKRDYILRIRSENIPPGSFETYQITGQQAVFLNDGNHRLMTIFEYDQNPRKYGDTKDTVENILRACVYSVTHHHYSSHEEAHIDFILVNLGTVASPYEMCHGFLMYMGVEGTEEVYKEIFEHLHTMIENNSSRVVGAKSKAADQTQKFKRHGYGLLYRSLSKDKTRSKYDSAKNKLSYEDIKRGKTIESQLVMLLKQKTADAIREDVKSLERLINAETSLIESIWNQLRKDPNSKIQHAAYKWLLDVAIWRRNNNIPTNKWQEFLTTFLSHTQGASLVKNPEDDRKFETVKVSDVTCLGKICKLIKSDFSEEFGKRKSRAQERKSAPPGMDVSHKLPFAEHGEGEVFIEPLSLNRARGAKPVDVEDAAG